MKNMKIAVKATIASMVVLITGFLIICKVIAGITTDMINEQITNQMTDAVESRTAIMEDYVKTAEDYLKAYSKSNEIRDIFRSGEDPAVIANAQQYTVDYTSVKGEIFEGIYAANKNTTILVHNNEMAVGKTTRSAEELPAFQADVFASDKVTNYGIMPSRGTGEMCISMYYPIFENNTVIGYVGGAVFASHMMDAIHEFSIEGLPDAEYMFFSAATGEYLYNDDPELICTVTKEPGCLQVMELLKDKDAENVGMITYTDNEGVDQMLVYKYMADRDWVFAIKDTTDHIYEGLNKTRKFNVTAVSIIGIILTAGIIVIFMMIARALKIISESIASLGDMNLDADKALGRYNNRGDEIGVICKALNKTCSNLRTYIGEVDAQLSSMANGDFTKESRVEFAGEFKNLKDSMDRIRGALRNSFTEISVVSAELVNGSQSVADSASQLADAATRSNLLVAEIDEHVADITERVEVSATLAAKASDEADDAADLVAICNEKMDELINVLNNINDATSQIAGISNKLERIAKQTNILALNAVVEAGNAGSAGKGFAVVANEIRSLAEESNRAAVDSYNIIHEAIAVTNKGLEAGEATSEYLKKVVAQTETIDGSVSEIADLTKHQNEKLKAIRDRLQEISHVVELTAGMSEQCAAASVELDGQTNVLRENINGYRV